MGWKAIGHPLVRQQRGRWVVRVDGVDTETGKHRPRQLGTYPSRRAAGAAARAATAEGTGSSSKGTVGWLVRRWVRGRTDVGVRTKEQYEWAIPHIEVGLGAIPLDRLDREDVAAWLETLADGGRLSRRSVQVCRMVLRAALADAVDEGLVQRSAAARVAMPKHVAKPGRVQEVQAWDDDQVRRFLDVIAGHRWQAPLRLTVLYGLRRSELLGLKWDDIDATEGTVRIDEALVTGRYGTIWTEGKSARSRRLIPVDPETSRVLGVHRTAQREERLVAGPEWEDSDLVVATHTGRPVIAANFDDTLERLIVRAGLPRLTSHGLRHTAATHMVRSAADVGELRAAAEVLGHSPDMLMRVYAHALPDSLRAVATKVGERAGRP